MQAKITQIQSLLQKNSRDQNHVKGIIQKESETMKGPIRPKLAQFKFPFFKRVDRLPDKSNYIQKAGSTIYDKIAKYHGIIDHHSLHFIPSN